WTDREAGQAERPPPSVIIGGGGPIGLELSQVFARFGVKVAIVEGMNRVLAMEEPEASAVLARVLEQDGIELYLNVHAKSVEPRGDAVTVNLDDGRQVTGDRLLVATGRQIGRASCRERG